MSNHQYQKEINTAIELQFSKLPNRSIVTEKHSSVKLSFKDNSYLKDCSYDDSKSELSFRGQEHEKI